MNRIQRLDQEIAVVQAGRPSIADNRNNRIASRTRVACPGTLLHGSDLPLSSVTRATWAYIAVAAVRVSVGSRDNGLRDAHGPRRRAGTCRFHVAAGKSGEPSMRERPVPVDVPGTA